MLESILSNDVSLLNDKVKSSILSFSFSANILAENPKDPKLNAWTREDILPGYKTFLTLNDICLEKTHSTAHLFFAEYMVIETSGYLGS
jgi:hypothetical protein